MSRPTHQDLAGSRYLALRALARATGRSTAELLQLYALEGFLARLASSPQRERLVLKGGVLLAALDARRPTRDVDLLALRIDNELDAVRVLVSDIAVCPMDDGLVLESGAAESIREGDAYAGVRVTVRGTLATARLVFHVDVNIGDPVWPAPRPVVLPRLLGSEPIVLAGYPLTMVLAEKIVTALQRGTANTRWRDFADIFVLARGHTVAGEEIQRSVAEVAAFRGVQRTSLADALAGFELSAQARWQVWHRAQGLGERVPVRFGEVLALVLEFAGPVVACEVAGAVWDPASMAWERGGLRPGKQAGFEP